MFTNTGAFEVDTGIYTGRSPQDKYFVEREPSKSNIWWSPIPPNKPVSEKTFNVIYGDVKQYMNGKEAALPQAIENVIVKKLPGITNLAPFRYRPINTGAVSFVARLTDSNWARPFLNMPLDILDTVSVKASFGRDGSSLDADVSAPDVVWGDRHFKRVGAKVRTVGDMLSVDGGFTNMRDEKVGTDIGLKLSAGFDRIAAQISLDNHAKAQRLRGALGADVAFRKTPDGKTLALVNFNNDRDRKSVV